MKWERKVGLWRHGQQVFVSGNLLTLEIYEYKSFAGWKYYELETEIHIPALKDIDDPDAQLLGELYQYMKSILKELDGYVEF